MNLSAVKLVVFDMDGTLLNDNHEVSERFFEQYKYLSKCGIHFAAASGRQYQSIRHTLSPIKDDISIIAENGGVLQYNNDTITLLKLNFFDVNNCIDLLRCIKDCFIVLCGKQSAYIEQNDKKFLNILKNYYHNITYTEDLQSIRDEEFLKIAVFHFQSSEQFILPHVNTLKSKLKVIVSAKQWLDISPFESNKGYALHILQQKLGLSNQETLVFGDYNNDLEMLGLGDFSFAMQNAHPDVLALANFQTLSNNEQGVEHVLDMLMSSNGFKN